MPVGKTADGLNKALEGFRPGGHNCATRLNARKTLQHYRASWFNIRLPTPHFQPPIFPVLLFLRGGQIAREGCLRRHA
jgi:hypothetical protein